MKTITIHEAMTRVCADIPAPNLEGLVVMDAIGRVSDFGDKVLTETRKLKSLNKAGDSVVEQKLDELKATLPIRSVADDIRELHNLFNKIDWQLLRSNPLWILSKD